MLALAATPLVAQSTPQQERPTFRSAVDRVSITAVVRKPNGQPVMNLKQSDFELLDNGRPREILEFRSDPTPATMALPARAYRYSSSDESRSTPQAMPMWWNGWANAYAR